MSKSRVTYDKKMREIALAASRGLYTLELIDPSTKRPGKFGYTITLQGPTDTEEREMLWEFARKVMEYRSNKYAPTANVALSTPTTPEAKP